MARSVSGTLTCRTPCSLPVTKLCKAPGPVEDEARGSCVIVMGSPVSQLMPSRNNALGTKAFLHANRVEASPVTIRMPDLYSEIYTMAELMLLGWDLKGFWPGCAFSNLESQILVT